jgi:hypothetical protein
MSDAAKHRGQHVAHDQRANEPPTGLIGQEDEAEAQDAPADEETGSHTPQEDVQEDPARD